MWHFPNFFHTDQPRDLGGLLAQIENPDARAEAVEKLLSGFGLRKGEQLPPERVREAIEVLRHNRSHRELTRLARKSGVSGLETEISEGDGHYWEAARLAEREGDPQRALKNYRGYYTGHYDDIRALALLSGVAVRLGLRDSAESFYHKALNEAIGSEMVGWSKHSDFGSICSQVSRERAIRIIADKACGSGFGGMVVKTLLRNCHYDKSLHYARKSGNLQNFIEGADLEYQQVYGRYRKEEPLAVGKLFLLAGRVAKEMGNNDVASKFFDAAFVYGTVPGRLEIAKEAGFRDRLPAAYDAAITALEQPRWNGQRESAQAGRLSEEAGFMERAVKNYMAAKMYRDAARVRTAAGIPGKDTFRELGLLK